MQTWCRKHILNNHSCNQDYNDQTPVRIAKVLMHNDFDFTTGEHKHRAIVYGNCETKELPLCIEIKQNKLSNNATTSTFHMPRNYATKTLRSMQPREARNYLWMETNSRSANENDLVGKENLFVGGEHIWAITLPWGWRGGSFWDWVWYSSLLPLLPELLLVEGPSPCVQRLELAGLFETAMSPLLLCEFWLGFRQRLIERRFFRFRL